MQVVETAASGEEVACLGTADLAEVAGRGFFSLPTLALEAVAEVPIYPALTEAVLVLVGPFSYGRVPHSPFRTADYQVAPSWVGRGTRVAKPSVRGCSWRVQSTIRSAMAIR